MGFLLIFRHNMGDELTKKKPEHQLVGGLEHEFYFSIYFRNVIIHIIPTDFHSIIFQRGRLTNHQPDHQWIGLRENLNRKPSIVPLNTGVFRLTFSLKPIH